MTQWSGAENAASDLDPGRLGWPAPPPARCAENHPPVQRSCRRSRPGGAREPATRSLPGAIHAHCAGQRRGVGRSVSPAPWTLNRQLRRPVQGGRPCRCWCGVAAPGSRVLPARSQTEDAAATSGAGFHAARHRSWGLPRRPRPFVSQGQNHPLPPPRLGQSGAPPAGWSRFPQARCESRAA